jgi:hypothetical protein
MAIWDNLTNMIVTLLFLNNPDGIKTLEKLITLFLVIGQKIIDLYTLAINMA